MQIISFPIVREAGKKGGRRTSLSEETVARAWPSLFSSWICIMAHSPKQSEQNPVVRTLGFILLSISDKNLAAFLILSDSFWAALKMLAKKLYYILWAQQSKAKCIFG